MSTHTCNVCGIDMHGEWICRFGGFGEALAARYCDNPVCPNFALLQVPVEELPEYTKDHGEKKDR